MKKKLALIMAALMAMMSLAACGGSEGGSDVLKISICQLEQHE